MNAQDLTTEQQDLVRHAAAMGGWLTTIYVNGLYRGNIHDLIDGTPEPLFDFEEAGVPRYRLTDAGQAVAAELNGGR